LKSIGVSAGMSGGGYAWAKFGFVPSQMGWNDVRSELGQKADRDLTLTPDMRAQIKVIAGMENPKAMWVLASLKDSTGASIGKRYLRGQSWGGKLDLNSKEEYSIVRNYVGRVGN
jgi:hypothetical protein